MNNRKEVLPILVAKTLTDSGGEFLVMVVCDGYAMCRRPGCAPFVRSVQELQLLLKDDKK